MCFRWLAKENERDAHLAGVNFNPALQAWPDSIMKVPNPTTTTSTKAVFPPTKTVQQSEVLVIVRRASGIEIQRVLKRHSEVDYVDVSRPSSEDSGMRGDSHLWLTI
ncbi:hypothetical protein NPIL_202431 [Nephila pilipes]|uniref:Uncharacterized protein n=1 Tax=Nephila pilipes TaxID=299642 RepID=A0A8X6IW49_NEPPI|nr:hypothetical protein NPIL_202431 [Nephila pilipes]